MDNLAGPDMLIDGYDQYNQRENEVVDITPEDAAEEPAEAPPRADDFEAMKKHVLVDIPDTEVEAEGYHTWHIEKWRTLSRREHGPTFECGGYPWRVLFFPYGNQVDCASFYLEHGFENEPPPDWYACVQFALVLWNPNDPTLYRTHTATHRFNAREGDWGFTRFVELRKAFHQPWEDGARHLVENDEAQLTAYVRIVKDPTGVLWHNFEGYDSKKETGMVGLKNQGATCYLNSLLQSLYFTDAFRKAVYQIPTEDEANESNSAWTLQRLFYRLQKDESAVSTSELTASFGWDTRQIFEQQDVQELSRILMEVMEKKMKGTPAERALPDLFVGKTKTYISCINVDYESSRIEEFWDIQLNVRGNRNLHESFMDYIQVETLEGENKYDAGEPYKLQDAKKGVIFESFPPILHLQLKRFEYDIHRDAMMKVNDRHEFPDEFDASLYLSDEAKAASSEPWIYQLHGVLVHSGDFNAGHYYAFLKPTKDGHFYKFDDDRVTRSTMKEVLEENFGGEYANVANGGPGQRQPYMRGYSTKRSMNAYMLVYIRKSRLDQVLLGVKESDIPPHIEDTITREKVEDERRRKEKEEEHLTTVTYVITDRTFRAHNGFDLAKYQVDPTDPAAAVEFKPRKTSTVSEFASDVAKRLDLEPGSFRFWVMVGRQNKTTRPDQPIREMDITMDEAETKYGSRRRPFFLWVEEGSRSEDGKVYFPDPALAVQGNTPILVFLKYFDVKAQALSGLAHVYVKKFDKVSDLALQINTIMQWDPSVPIFLFEEIKFSMIEALRPKQTFKEAEIQDGDIICFQQQLPDLDQATVTYTDARQYYDYLLNKILVTFRPKPGTEGQTFVLGLSKKMNYDQFAAKVGEHLGIDPTHIRFATVAGNQIRMWIKRHMTLSLQQLLQPQTATQRSNALFYEILETSLADYETKKIMKVTWLSDGISKEEPLEILVAKNGIVGDVISGIARKFNLDPQTNHNIRMLEVHGGKIHKELIEDFNVVGVNEFTTLYAEKIPDEELNASDDDRFIYCYHFDKETNKPHGVPFKFMLKPGEPLKETRERIGKRTGIRGKLLQQIKFALVPRALYAKPRYLEDDDVIVDLIQDGDEMLGLDHVNKAKNFWGRAEGMFIR